MILVYKKLKFIYKDLDFALNNIAKPQKKIINEIGNNKINIVTSNSGKVRILKDTKLAIAASGTVILELSRNQIIPSIVVYDSNFFTSLIVKIFSKVKMG